MHQLTGRVELGQADLERNLEALKDACGRYAPGRPVKECVDRVDAHKPKSGIVEGARAQLAGLEAFIRTHDLVTIPGTEVAIVKESPPYMRWNSAFINTRGPFEKELPSIYYVSPPDPKWTKAEQAAYIPGTATLLYGLAPAVMARMESLPVAFAGGIALGVVDPGVRLSPAHDQCPGRADFAGLGALMRPSVGT